MDPNITGYNITIQVRDAGERTTAYGWIEIDGKRHDFRAEASATNRGATYYLDGEPHWWNEVQWLDEWFEDLWQEAAAKHWHVEIGEPEDFTEHMTNEMEEQDDA